MTRREKWLVVAVVILALLLLLSIPLRVRSQEKPVEGPQIVMKVVGGALGPWTAVEPQDVVIRLGLVPANPEEHYAPQIGDSILCHAFTPDGIHYGYRCGSDIYMVARFDVFPKHKPKKE